MTKHAKAALEAIFKIAARRRSESILSICILALAQTAFGYPCESLLSPFYKTANPSAQFAPHNYKEPNKRPLSVYNHILFAPMNTSAKRFVPQDGSIVESGCGLGMAMRELAECKRFKRMTLINTQDLWGDLPPPAPLEYVTGWAEEEIPRLDENSVDVFIDLWGAFAYSPDKAFLIEQMYRKLKPGGRSALLYPRSILFTIVQMGNRAWHLEKFLTAHSPQGVFQIFDTYDGHKVFLFTKPQDHPPELKFGLQVISARPAERGTLPQAVLGARP